MYLLVSDLVCFVFSGEENSRVQAHIEGDEFSAHILTDEAEYNVEVGSGCKNTQCLFCKTGILIEVFVLNLTEKGPHR